MKKQLLFIAFMSIALSTLSQTTYTVNSTADFPDSTIGDSVCADESGNCTLRAAIQNANKTSNKDIIEFNIPGAAPFVIIVVDVLQPIQRPVVIDGRTQQGYINSPIIEIDGSSLPIGYNGVQLIGSSAGSEIYGLSIGGFKRLIEEPYSYGYGVFSNTGNHTFQSNYVGLKPDGTTINSNTGGGMYFNNNGGNLIGGTQPGQGNVISGNESGGLTFQGTTTNSAASNNLIQGNLIGTDASGTLNRGNRFNFQFLNAPNNVLGGSTPGARNVISGANAADDDSIGSGISIVGSESYGNSIIGNYIGTDITGTASISNVRGGVFILFGANNNDIGTDTPGEGNLISGNGQYGIYFQGGATSPVDSNSVKGNYLGVDVSGNLALPNSVGIMMLVGENNSNFIGGTTENSRNIISGNGVAGIIISSGNKNLITGNWVGIGKDGTSDVGNGIVGISLSDSSVGTLIIKNKIAFNQRGVDLSPGSGTPIENTISQNSIYENAIIGIDLVPTTINDIDDADSGANNLQNTPEISAITYLGENTLEITYEVSSSVDNSAYPLIIEFFGAVGGQGKYYIQSDTYMDPGNKTITINLPDGFDPDDYLDIVATATDADGNTSEFGETKDSTLFVRQFQTNDFKVHPNPVSDRLFIQASVSESYRLSVSNSLGQIVMTIEEGNLSPSINVASLSEGLYFLDIRSKAGNYKTIKFLKN